MTSLAIVNAAGPWIREVAERMTPHPPIPSVELVQGSHLELPGKNFTHLLTALVYVNTEYITVRAGKIYIFKNTRTGGLRILADMGVQFTIQSDVYRFTRLEITHQGEVQGVQSHTFRCYRVLPAPIGIFVAQYNGANTMRVTETQHAFTGDHRDNGIGSLATLV